MERDRRLQIFLYSQCGKKYNIKELKLTYVLVMLLVNYYRQLFQMSWVSDEHFNNKLMKTQKLNRIIRVEKKNQNYLKSVTDKREEWSKNKAIIIIIAT